MLITICDMGWTMLKTPGSASVEDLAGLAVRRHFMFSGEGLATKSPFTQPDVSFDLDWPNFE